MIACAVWAYHRFALSTADFEDLLAERGVIVSREAIRLWVNRFGAQFARCIRRDRCVFHGRWALIPRHRGQPFHASGGLADRLIESGSTRWVKRFRRARALAHAFADKGQPVRVMDEPVENGIGNGRIPDCFVSMLDRELAGDDRGAAAVSVFKDFQQIAPFR